MIAAPTPPARPSLIPSLPAVEKMYVRFAGFLPSVAEFDASLFRLAAAEAAYMDPQSRTLLEQTHLALVDASGRLGRPVPSDAGV